MSEARSQGAKSDNLIKAGLTVSTSSTVEIDPILETFLDTQDCGFCLFEPSGLLKFYNSRAADMLGISPDADGVCLQSLEFPVLHALFQASLTESDDVFVADVAIPAWGVAGELKTRAVKTDGQVTGVVCILRDTHREQELDRMKADFLAAVSHELRTPLTSIMGYSNLLIEAGDSIGEADRRQFLQTIEGQGRVLLQLINDIIEMAKLESDSVQLRQEVCDANSLMSGIVDEYLEAAMAKDLVLETRCAQASTLKVECDATRVRQALGHLIDNAIKFSEPGGRVVLEAKDKEGALLLLVSDSGIGISLEHQSRLFDKFYQVDSGASRRANGTGLGLAIVRRIVEMHNGTVFVESKPGQGSTFGISLPLAKDNLQSIDCFKINSAPVLVVAESGTPRSSLFRGVESVRASRPEEIRAWASEHRGAPLVLDCALAQSHQELFRAALEAAITYNLTVTMAGKHEEKHIWPFALKFYHRDILPESLPSQLLTLSHSARDTSLVMIDSCGSCHHSLSTQLESCNIQMSVVNSRWAVHQRIEEGSVGLLTACYCSTSSEGLSMLKGARSAGWAGNLVLFIGGKNEISSELAGWLAVYATEATAEADQAISHATELLITRLGLSAKLAA